MTLVNVDQYRRNSIPIQSDLLAGNISFNFRCDIDYQTGPSSSSSNNLDAITTCSLLTIFVKLMQFHSIQKDRLPIRPSQSLRNRSLRLKSLDRSNSLNKTIGFSPKNDTSQSKITQFVFNDKKKKRQISRIIDGYFDDRVELVPKQKSSSLSEFSQPRQVSGKRVSLKSKLSIPLDFGDQMHNQTLPTIKDIITLPPIFEQALQTSSRFNVLLLKMVSENPKPRPSRKPSKSKSKDLKMLGVNPRFSIVEGKRNVTKQFSSQGINFLYLQLRNYQVVKELGVDLLYTYDGSNILHYHTFCPFRKLLYSVTQQLINSEQAFRITPTPLYEMLFNNHNQLLLHLVKSLLIVLDKIKGKVVNNNINFTNIHYFKESLVIDSWATSALQETKLSSIKSHIVYPSLRHGQEWFVSLESLPPQFLESIAAETKHDMFQYPSSIDMWSVGSLLLQIITLVPLYSPAKWTISHTGKSRRGLYFGKINDIKEIGTRQRKLCGRLKTNLQKLGQLPSNLSPKVMVLLSRMLKCNPADRLTPQQGIKLIG